MQSRHKSLLIGAAAVALITACNDSLTPKAQFPNVEARPTLYALNGTAPGLPSAVQLQLASSARVDANFAFDLAFDIESPTEVKVYTVRSLANQVAAVGGRVGLQVTNELFDNITLAPTGNYAFDSTMVVPLGKTILVDVLSNNCSVFSLLGQDIHAKIIIDSLNTTSRAIFLHLVVNPNCGFRSFVIGELPKE